VRGGVVRSIGLCLNDDAAGVVKPKFHPDHCPGNDHRIPIEKILVHPGMVTRAGAGNNPYFIQFSE